MAEKIEGPLAESPSRGDLIITDRKKQFWLVVSVAFTSFMSRVDAYILNIALPTISNHFNINTAAASRLVLIYLLFLTSTLLLFGKVSDLIGSKRLFISGYACFILGSLLCGLAPNLSWMLVFRGVQGLGGAMLGISAFTIIPKFLPPKIIGWAFGVFATFSALGISLGAPLGGFLTGYLSWRWVFWVNVPVGILAIVVAWLVIPKEPFEKSRHPFDWLGSLTSFIGLSALVYALNMGKKLGWASPPILTAFLVAAGFLTFLIWWEKRHRDPIIELKYFSDSEFVYIMLAASLAFMFNSATTFLMPFYLQDAQGFSPQKAGLVFLIYSLVYMIVSPNAGRLSDKISPRKLCIFGTLNCGLSCLLFSFTLSRAGLLPVLIFLVWQGIGFASFVAPNNHQMMSLAPQGQEGVFSGAFRVLTSLSLIVGVAVFETIFSYGLPSGITSLGASGLSSKMLYGAFSRVYFWGGVVFLLSMAISALAVKRLRTPEPQDD